MPSREIQERATVAVPTTRAVITQECRENRGTEGAWDEAVRRLKVEYDAILDGWKDEDVQPEFVLSLLYERPIPDEAVPIPPLFCGSEIVPKGADSAH